MGIWIRSQNKLKLTECKEIIIDQNDCFEYIFEGYAIDDIPTILGIYSTEEKAIKVLDMIQNFIRSNERTFGNVAYEEEWSGEIVTRSNDVFKMPQDIIIIDDNEVEV